MSVSPLSVGSSPECPVPSMNHLLGFPFLGGPGLLFLFSCSLGLSKDDPTTSATFSDIGTHPFHQQQGPAGNCLTAGSSGEEGPGL